MATAKFGDKGQYTYNVDSKGVPYGAPITTTSDTPTNQPQSNTQTGGETSEFMKAIQEKLLGQSGVISSTNSKLEERLNNAIAGTQESAKKSNQLVTSTYDRQISDAAQTGQDNMINGRAAGAGGVLNIAALRELTSTTDKNLKDLEQRKQELILQNDANAASKVADLQFQALQFQQTAQQQVFSNLLGLGNFGIQQEQNELAKSNSVFQQNQAMSTIALQYGVKLNPGDTIDAVVNRAMPFASKEQQLNLAKLQSDINRNNAEISKINRDGAGYVTSANLDIIAQAAAINPAVLSTIKNPSELGSVVVKMNDIQKKNALNQIDYNIKSGQYGSKDAALNDIQESVSKGTLNAAYTQDAINYVNTNFKETPKTQSTLSKLIYGERNSAPTGYHYNIFGDLKKD